MLFLFGALTSNEPSLCLYPDLLGAVEEVLPSLKEQGSRVFILRERCDVEGIESLSDKIQQESDEPLSPHLRANITIKSPALYIYTSGTTGNPASASNLAFLVGVLTLISRLSTMKIFCSQHWCYLSGLPKAAVINQEKIWMSTFLQTIAGVRCDDVMYLYLPLYHSAGFLMGLCGAIENGDL